MVVRSYGFIPTHVCLWVFDVNDVFLRFGSVIISLFGDECE